MNADLLTGIGATIGVIMTAGFAYMGLSRKARADLLTEVVKDRKDFTDSMLVELTAVRQDLLACLRGRQEMGEKLIKTDERLSALVDGMLKVSQAAERAALHASAAEAAANAIAKDRIDAQEAARALLTVAEETARTKVRATEATSAAAAAAAEVKS